MTLAHILAIVAAGFGAGMINTIVGSGSLITYPVMVMLGVAPVQANIANTVGLVPGSLAGSWGYRRELGSVRHLLVRLGIASVAGAIIGAFLLTQLSASTFKYVVPVLILLAALLVAFQPRILRAMRPVEGTRWTPLMLTVFLAGIYGGYFSAAQGIILLGVLGLFLAAGLQVQNALKNLLQTLVNIVAAVFFVLTQHVLWGQAACIAVGSVAGAMVGAQVARRIPPQVFRVFIVVFGLFMSGYMAWRAVR